MKILYILREEPDETVRRIIQIQSEGNQTKTVNLATDRDYEAILTDIEDADRVIAW